MMIGTAMAARPARRMGFRKDMAKKHQAPITKHQRSTNNQAPEYWGLLIGDYLVLGYWCLVLSFRARPRPERQISAQDLVHGLAGIGEDVMAIVFLGARAQALAEGGHLAEVAFADFAGACEDFWDLLEAVELDKAHEWEFQLVRVHGVEENDFVAPETQMLNAVEHGLFVVEKIADDNDNAFAAELARHVVENGGNISLLAGLEGGEAGHEIMDGRFVVAAWRVVFHRVIEQRQGDGVTL